MQQTQIKNIAEEVEFHVSEITSLEENDITQDVRLAFVEDELDYWDDKITALEVANVDITDRLITVEEILLGEISYLKIDLNNMSHFAYARKMRYLLNLVFENSEYLWFY